MTDKDRIKELEYHIEALRGKLGTTEYTKVKMKYDFDDLTPIWAERYKKQSK